MFVVLLQGAQAPFCTAVRSKLVSISTWNTHPPWDLFTLHTNLPIILNITFPLHFRMPLHPPVLFPYLSGLTEWCLQPKSPLLLWFPGRWSASDADDSISEKRKSRSQTIRRGPITPSPRLPLAMLSSGPHLMDHNIILRHVPALYASSKHNSVAKAQ